ncbi:MAG: substrate-binding domain-containing protein [Kiritimatiellales bacterium]|jgi:LacI family transcriptional regulator
MKNIALIFAFQENSPFARNVVRGVLDCKKKYRLPWQLHLVEQTSFDPGIFKRQKYDGIIGLRPPSGDIPGIPCIHIAGQRSANRPGRFFIEQDNEKIIRIAVDHLWRKGCRNLALFGYPRMDVLRWQEERIEAFRKICAEYGASSKLFFPGRRAEQAGKKHQFIKKALLSLPVHSGVIAVNDFRALDVLDAAKRSGIRIPEQIAVMGIDHDEMLCSISSPPLTSIEHFPEKKGYHAALMLDALLRGEKEIPSFTSSLRLIERDSTDTMVHGNEQLLAAMEYIQHNAGTALRTEDIAQNAGVSRATVERMFRIELRSTVSREITAARVSLAKQKLSEPNLPIKEIAAQCGFRNVHYFTTVFKKSTGVSPGVYRDSVSRSPE